MTKSLGGQGHDNSAQLCVLLCETIVGAPGSVEFEEKTKGVSQNMSFHCL